MRTLADRRSSGPRNVVILAAAAALLAVVVLVPPPASLLSVVHQAGDAAGGAPRYPASAASGRPAMAALGVLAFCLVLWVTEAIPFHITGLLALALLTLLRVGGYKEIVAVGFGNDIVVFFIGVLVIGAFITRSGLGRRISALVLSVTGNDTRLILLGFLAAGTLVSMWITDMAVAAMLMPLARAILVQEGCRPKESNFGRGLMIAVAWGALIGGIATPAGTGSNPIALQFLSTMAGIHLTFLDWMGFGVPAALLLVLPSWGILLLFFPPEMKRLKVSREELRRRLSDMPPMGREEWLTLGVFVLTVAAWIASPFLEKPLGMAVEISLPALIAMCIFFLPLASGARWKDIEGEVDWAGILMIVSGISLGNYLYRTGVAPLAMQVFLVTLGVCLLKVVFSSNTVTATILIPLIIGLGRSTGSNVTAIALAAGLTSSLAFILVTSTPTNVIPFNAGYFTIGDMARAGLVLTLVAAVAVTVVFVAVGTLRGML